MSILITLIDILSRRLCRLMRHNHFRPIWFSLIFVSLVSFGTVEWNQPSYAGSTPPTGKIRIFKLTEPSGDSTEFTFKFSSATLNRNFSLADGGRRSFSNLAIGNDYEISETVPDGWMLQSASCENGSSVNHVQVDANEVVDCTFVNVKLGRIIIEVATLPDDDQSTEFQFTAGGGLTPKSFTLINGQKRTFANLVPGNRYNVAETVPSGWLLSDATCSDGSPISKIDVDAGETVTCIFVNKQFGKLVVQKVTSPNPDRTETNFAFTTENTLDPNSFTLQNGDRQVYNDLEPRAGYRIRELSTPNWQLTDSSCNNGTPITNIRIDPGQTVRCTFTNSGTLIDLSLTKDDGDIIAEPGDTIVYTLRYRNLGTQTATDVFLTEQVPANTIFVASSGSSSLWDCANHAQAGTICRYPIGALAAGAQGQVEFHVKVNGTLPATTTTIQNSAILGYHDNANASQSTTITPIKAKALLTLNKDDDGANVQPGEVIRYTLNYANEGNQAITGVRITETVPSNTTFAAVDQGWSCPNGAPAGTECVRTLGTLAAGNQGSVIFEVRVDSSLPPDVSTIINRAMIGSPTSPRADSGTEQTEVKAAPDLAVDIDDKGVTVAPGGIVHYNIAYANVGTQAATAVQVSVNLPEATTFVADQSTAGWSCTIDRCLFTVNTLASGASNNIEWTLRLDRPLAVEYTAIVATVAIADDGNNGVDPVLSNNLAIEETEIFDPGKVTATKRAELVIDQNSDGEVAPGDTIEYVVLLQNQRGTAVRNVVFTDTLSAQLELVAGLTTSHGSILSGSSSSDRHIQIAVGTIAADSTATIRFRVRVKLPAPNGVDEVANQGLVTSRDFAAMVTDNPASTAAHDATITPIISKAAVEMTLADFLLIDANSDALVSVGDTLIYRLIIRNRGDGGSPPLQVRIPLADNVVLVENAVTTTGGTIRAGSDPDDRIVRVDIGELAGRAEVRLSFQVRIMPFIGLSTIQHQAIAVALVPSSQVDIYSDDPDTSAAQDATVAQLDQAIVTIYPLYLPQIHK